MTNDELQALADKITSGTATNEEKKVFLEQADQALKDLVKETEQISSSSDDVSEEITPIV